MNSESSVSTWGDSETKYFYELTPEKILLAVEAFGFRCTGRCFALNSLENRVYEVEIEVEEGKKLKSPSEKFRIVKFYRPGRWSKEQIKEEHQFLLDLVELEIPVIAPLVFNETETVLTLPDCNIYAAVFLKAGGRSPDELTDEQFPLVGRLLARMHNVGAVKEAKHRIRLSAETYGRASLNNIVDSGHLIKTLAEPYADLVKRLCDKIDPLLSKVKVQRVHGDCHLRNLLWGNDGPFWVDFDDMVMAPAVQDMWLLVPGRDEYSRDQLHLLVEAYEQMREFDWQTLKLIEPLRTLRLIHFSGWIAKRYQDPAFKNAFPEFGTEKYWHEQISILNEQQQLIVVS